MATIAQGMLLQAGDATYQLSRLVDLVLHACQSLAVKDQAEWVDAEQGLVRFKTELQAKVQQLLGGVGQYGPAGSESTSDSSSRGIQPEDGDVRGGTGNVEETVCRSGEDAVTGDSEPYSLGDSDEEQRAD